MEEGIKGHNLEESCSKGYYQNFLRVLQLSKISPNMPESQETEEKWVLGDSELSCWIKPFLKPRNLSFSVIRGNMIPFNLSQFESELCCLQPKLAYLTH